MGETTRLPLGQKVEIAAMLVSQKRYPNRTYKRVETTRQGYTAGVRTLKEGRSHSDEGHSFTATKHIRVFLVAVNHSQILRVLPEDCRVID